MTDIPKKIVMTAYDVNPYRGSESGTGWNFPFHIADPAHHITLITRPNNRPHIEKFLQEKKPDAAAYMSFAYFDLPYWVRFWKKGARGVRLYFWLWQFFVVRFIRRENLQADIYHGLNFHSDTTPSFLWRLPTKSVWGPINHNEPIPGDFLPNTKFRVQERLKWTLRRIIWAVGPFSHLARRKTNLILAANRSVVHRLKLDRRGNYAILNSIAAMPQKLEESPTARSDLFHFLSVGRFVPIKAMGFALEAFEKFYSGLPEADQVRVKFMVIGTGPQEKDLHAMVAGFESRNAIEFKPWIAQAELFQIYRDAQCFLNFSHEGAGAVNAEAMAAGLPILCFDNFGPGEIVNDDVGRKIPLTDYSSARDAAAEKMQQLFEEPSTTESLGCQAKIQFGQKLSWQARADRIKALYQTL